jgi:hypothetical protein
MAASASKTHQELSSGAELSRSSAERPCLASMGTASNHDHEPPPPDALDERCGTSILREEEEEN